MDREVPPGNQAQYPVTAAPFRGARMSGTSDKAGSSLNFLLWISPRTIKETFVPPTEWRYPYLG